VVSAGMNKCLKSRSGEGRANVWVWISAAALLAAALDQMKPFLGARGNAPSCRSPPFLFIQRSGSSAPFILYRSFVADSLTLEQYLTLILERGPPLDSIRVRLVKLLQQFVR